ncbi:uncharacterized protein LOC135484739 isoform X2 [Lineus longissimus]|uniref:uncharacterized protein LOC135484739 isoform X2 n=1 Tax=Lineus longissimus TaxID=88925 RepID=UPI00315D2B3A
MNGSMGEGVKSLKKRVKKKYELNGKTELHLIYSVDAEGQKLGAPRVEFHQREPLVEMPSMNGDINGEMEITGIPPPRSPSPRPQSPSRPMSPPKSPLRPKSPQRPMSPMRASAPFGMRYGQAPGGRRAASAILTGAVSPPLGDFEDVRYIPLQGVKATDMDYEHMPLPAIRPMDGAPIQSYNEPSYSTHMMPRMEQAPPQQDYYQSWVHNARPPSTDRRVNMSYPVSAPRFHHGRLGSTWRHVRQCTGNAGNHIVFIDGTVKSEDVQRFPPWGYRAENQTIYNQPTYYSTMTGLPKKLAFPGAYENQYHERAKNGHKYWQEQKRVHSPKTRPLGSILKNPKETKGPRSVASMDIRSLSRASSVKNN